MILARGEPEAGRKLELGAGRRAGLAALRRLVRAHPERLPEYMAVFATWPVT